MDGELFPGVTLDDLGAAAFPNFLRPIAGGSPGVLSQFRSAFDWARSSAFGEAGSAIAGRLNYYTGKAAEAVTGVMSIMTWWIYRFTRSALFPFIPSWYRPNFPDPNLVKNLTPWYYFHKVFHLIGRVIHHRAEAWAYWINARIASARAYVEGRLNAWSKWVRDRVNEARNYLYNRVGHVWTWIRDRAAQVKAYVEGRLSAWTRWGRDRMIEARNYVWNRITQTYVWLRDRLTDARNYVVGRIVAWSGWVRDRLIEARNYVVGRIQAWSEWLWGKVSGAVNAVTSAVVGAVVSGGELIGQAVRDAFEWFVGKAFTPFIDLVKVKLAIPGKLIGGKYTSLNELVEDMLDPPDEMLGGWTGMMMFPFIIIGLLVNLVTGLSGPLLDPILQEQRKTVGARIPPFQMMRQGFLRGEMAEGVHDDWLGRTGFDAANIALTKALYSEIPGSTDLVRMGVREAFTPEIAEKFGQYEDFPPAFGEWMEKQGFDLEWAERFWAAHWDLPGVRDAFEMFHRGVISQEELDLLLRALDIMPFWRDKLTEIAHQRITRVDLRRMYKAGSINIERVEKGYKDLGYSEEDALAITEWVRDNFGPDGGADTTKLREAGLATIRKAYAFRLILRVAALDRLMDLRYTPAAAELTVTMWDFEFQRDADQRSEVNPKQLARGVVEDTYRRRLVSFNIAVEELTEQGYTPEDAQLLLQRVDLTLAEELADLEVRIVLEELEAGSITLAGMAARLGDLNVPEARIQHLVERETLRREAKSRRLSLAQLKRAVTANIIGIPEWERRLDAMGYNRRDIGVLTELNAEQFGLA